MKIIGDVHGKVLEYQKLIENCDFSICVGDFGFKKEWEWHKDMIGYPHWINPGNHDWNGAYQSIEINGEYLSTGNFRSFSKRGIFTIRGANSIDKHLRTEGVDWFRNEELTISEGYEVLDQYLEDKPTIVISHDCPQLVMEELFGYKFKSIDPSHDKSLTRQLLQAMFEEHQPELWVFGHHHRSKDQIIDGTQFICLNELETFEI